MKAGLIYIRRKDMFKANENYLKLPGSYLFSTVGRKQREYSAAHPDKKVIRLSIGDVTQPDRKSTRLNSSHSRKSRMPSSA